MRRPLGALHASGEPYHKCLILKPASMRRVKVKVTLKPVVYRQSVRLGANPLEAHDQMFLLCPGTDGAEKSLPLLRVLSLPGKQRVHRTMNAFCTVACFT
jgi:hypothetical protein